MASSIQVLESTRKRLAAYKMGGMTYDHVLNLLMTLIPVERLEPAYREYQHRMVEYIRNSPEWLRGEDLVHSETRPKKA